MYRLPVVEIFHSMQGEGYNTGLQTTFLRLGECNLACPWCDTNYKQYDLLDESTIVERVLALPTKNLIVTGGEPLIHAELPTLLEHLKAAGFWLGLETNGLLDIPTTWRHLLSYVAVSPKALYAALYADDKMLRRADEVRVVVDGDILDFCHTIRQRVTAQHYYLSPCEQSGSFNFLESVRLLGELNRAHKNKKWQLSLQTHKLGNFA